MAFRQLREVFNIDPGDYMLSICGTLSRHLCAAAKPVASACLLAVMLSLCLGLPLGTEAAMTSTLPSILGLPLSAAYHPIFF